jgi:hypothetical protein
VESPARDLDQVGDDFQCEGLFFFDQASQASDQKAASKIVVKLFFSDDGMFFRPSNNGGVSKQPQSFAIPDYDQAQRLAARRTATHPSSPTGAFDTNARAPSCA